MKLGTDIRNVSGHCWEGFQGQRSKVKVTARPNALCGGGIDLDIVATVICVSVVDLVTKKITVRGIQCPHVTGHDSRRTMKRDKRRESSKRTAADATVGRGQDGKLMECTVSWTLLVDGRRKPTRRTVLPNTSTVALRRFHDAFRCLPLSTVSRSRRLSPADDQQLVSFYKPNWIGPNHLTVYKSQ